MIERIKLGHIQPHRWDECVPLVRKTQDMTVDEELTRRARRSFRKLRVDERIKFHQATCQMRKSPAHDAVIAKIKALLDRDATGSDPRNLN